MGALAKMVATVVTYPLQIAQSRLRTHRVESRPSANNAHSAEPVYSGTVDVLMKLYQKGGFLDWFRGMEAKLWQTVLTAAFQFSVYERIQLFIFWLLLQDKFRAPSSLN